MSPILGIWASQISGRLWEPQGAFDALSTVTVPSGGVASVTFAGIPNTYKHLQIRAMARNATNTRGAYIVLNSDSGANYTLHRLVGDGSSATAGAFTGQTSFIVSNFPASSSFTSGIFGVGIIDILDYTNTSKNKTMRSLNGADNNGSGTLALQSSLWINTNAINSITITPDSTSFAEYSQFTLYGIR